MSGLWKWIFYRQNTMEKILIMTIILGAILLFKDSILNLMFGKLGEANSLIDQILN